MASKWGILGAAGIARKKFLPAAERAASADVVAIASRSEKKGQALADEFGVSRIYDRPEDLFADPDIDAIYIPLPNRLHVEATLQAVAAGKHVLCEKPISLLAAEIDLISDAAIRADRHVIEGLMVAYHPQWQKVKEWIAEERIGTLQRIEGVFSYFLNDSSNIRNGVDGGALRDIGVYPIFLTRLISAQEPLRVFSQGRSDESAASDTQTAAWMEFEGFDASFFVSARADRSESLTIYGTHGRIEVPKAYNPPDSGEQRIHLFKSNELVETETFCDVFQFALQIEHLSEVFAGRISPLVTLENSSANQRVVDAILRSNASGEWEEVRGADDL